MKVLAYSVVHYGKEWIAKAIESVKDHVDNHLIMYTAKPSFGYASNLPNPDSGTELKEICDKFPHVIWNTVNGINQENQHRQAAIDYARKHGYTLCWSLIMTKYGIVQEFRKQLTMHTIASLDISASWVLNGLRSGNL